MPRQGFLSAGKFQVTVNAKELLKELTVDNDRAMGTTIRNYVAPKLQKKQERLVKNFLTNKITIELKAGPTASNTSGILGGYGNLFSFIGFDAGTDPTDIIEKIFGARNEMPLYQNIENDQNQAKITKYLLNSNSFSETNNILGPFSNN